LLVVGLGSAWRGFRVGVFAVADEGISSMDVGCASLLAAPFFLGVEFVVRDYHDIKDVLWLDSLRKYDTGR
jgi:hypothetical protein